MTKKKPALTAEEKQIIDEQETNLKAILERVERARQFKVGDFLIMWLTNYQGGWVQQVNSYGAPTKYQVVHTTESGIPFMKQINAHGTTVGELIAGIGGIDDGYIDNGGRSRWELDPDYADSLLLQDEYDPAQLHNNKKMLWKEVTEHNKKCRVSTKDIPEIVEFLKTLKAGDLLWTSNVSHMLIREVKAVTKQDAMKLVSYRFSSRVRGPFILVVTVVDKKGVVKEVAADYFFRKALYRLRPRTYKELNL